MADPRRRAAAYSNPSLGLAFESLADVFGPPSGSDLYGYTRAGAEREKAQRLSDVYRRATAPGASIDALDLPAIAAGLYAPNASGWAVRTKDETDRRGQDIGSADNRYNVDSRDRTSRANNADTNRTHVVTTYGAAIPKDAYRPELPKTTADMYGLAPIPAQRGVIAAQPGERNYLPDGSVLEGAPKPLTETELKAKIIAEMPKARQEDIVFGATPVDETAGGPRTRLQRLDTNTPELPKEPAQVYNWRTPDGKRGGTAVMRNGKLFDSQTNVELPPGVAVQGAGAAQGKDGALGPTMANQTSANSRSAEDTVALNQLDLYETLIRNNPGTLGVVGAIRGTAQDAVASANDFVNAFGDKAPQMKDAAQAVRAGLQGVAPELFDPAIPEADFMRGTLAYAIARTENPSGEVSRQAYDRAYARLGGGMLANQASALAQIGAFRKVLQAKQAGTATLRDPSQARTDTGYQAPPAAQRPRVINPQTKQVLEWDGQNWSPVQ